MSVMLSLPIEIQPLQGCAMRFFLYHGLRPVVMHMLPISQVENTVKRPSKGYPKEVVTVGDQIRKRRIDLKLFQREVGKMVGASKYEVCQWENNKIEVPKRLQSKITEFLGYEVFM
jgi:DNA-binding XRE family transcriptional regulator